MSQRVLFTGGGDRSLDRAIQRAEVEGKVVRVHEGIYVEKGHEPIERVVSARWAEVLAKIAPGSCKVGAAEVVSHGSKAIKTRCKRTTKDTKKNHRKATRQQMTIQRKIKEEAARTAYF